MHSKEFVEYYEKVRPIILKLKGKYSLKYWELDDWEQEGRLVLYQLLMAHQEVRREEQKLFVYFKTRFSNYIKDQIRKQESYKRRFDKMVYEEISENSNRIGAKGMALDDFVAFNELIEKYKGTLSDEENDLFDKIIAGERFKGKKEMVDDLRSRFKDFGKDSFRR